MFAVLAICLFVVSANCVPIQQSEIEREWLAFKREFRGERYFGGDAEEAVRRQVFESNYRFIVEHNAQADQGLQTYWVGVNEFSDLTNEEFRQRFLNFKPTRAHLNVSFANIEVDTSALADNVDWRDKNVVTHIKNQGQCGSCFAFSAVDSIESAAAIATGKLETLAPQQIVDCMDHSAGDVCETGGDMVEAMELVIKEGGLERESDYPYRARMSKTCAFTKSKKVVSITGVKNLQTGSESALQQAVGTVGPISIGIDAGGSGFQSYRSGVYTASNCHNQLDKLNHGVLAVGYGTESGKDYWLVKNSWGTSFGAQGYIKMARNHNNMCGIATYANYPTGASS